MLTMINEFLDDSDEPAVARPLFDVGHVESLLQSSAQHGVAMSYSELLLTLGYRFTRPKMRALCRVLDEIDRRAAFCGQPELAALVVREGDRLPGQGWWIGRTDYQGEWTGSAARAYLDAIQNRAFSFWQTGGGDA
jgi:hypothetical protein